MDDLRRSWEERFDRLDAYLRKLRERTGSKPPTQNGHIPCGPGLPRN